MSKKTSRKARQRKRTARRRISTRRPSTTTGRRGARLESAAAEAAASLKVRFRLTDVAGKPVRDPETFFTFRRLSNHRQLGDQLQVELTGGLVDFDVPVATNQVLVCEIDPRRFRFVHSPVFFGTPGAPISRAAHLFREPDQWTPRFTRWADLPTRFDRLKAVLRNSKDITLVKETEAIADRLVEDVYDGLNAERLRLAKTALLNIYYRLNAPEPISQADVWFSFVTRILALGRERVLALADPALATVVRHIHTNIGEFKADYDPTPAENHRGNVPVLLQGRIDHMLSIKSSHAKGNLQLTVTQLRGMDEVLLDADIDESGELLAHFLDLFKHKLTGGTHPHDIHELLVLQDSQTPGFDLGYTLV